MFYKIQNKKIKIILAIQIICMFIAASTHVLWIAENGIYMPNINHPFISTIFWDSLTFIDIIAVILLIIRPKLGVFITLIIIIVDVIHNNIVVIIYNQHINDIGIKMWAIKYWMLIGQILFMIFVISTLKTNLTELKKEELKKMQKN